MEMYSGTTRTGHNSWPTTAPAIDAMLKGLSYSLNIRGLSPDGQDAHPINYLNVTGLPLPVEGMDSPRGRQIQFFEAYRLFGEALRATGRNITYSICPLIAGCDESIWSYYKDQCVPVHLLATVQSSTHRVCFPHSMLTTQLLFSWVRSAHLSMNQCPQEDNTDNWESFLFHIDDNNAFPSRADIAGPGYWNGENLSDTVSVERTLFSHCKPQTTYRVAGNRVESRLQNCCECMVDIDS